jgi:hypothetical protein
MRSRALLTSALLAGIFLMPVVIRELNIKVNVRDTAAQDAP